MATQLTGPVMPIRTVSFLLFPYWSCKFCLKTQFYCYIFRLLCSQTMSNLWNLSCRMWSLAKCLRPLAGSQEGEGPSHLRGWEELQGVRQPAYGSRQRSSLWHPRQESQGGRRAGCGEKEVKIVTMELCKIKCLKRFTSVIFENTLEMIWEKFSTKSPVWQNYTLISQYLGRIRVAAVPPSGSN